MGRKKQLRKPNVSKKEFLENRGFEVLAIGKNFQGGDFCTVERPADTSDRGVARLMRLVRGGYKGLKDYSRKALVWDKNAYMYYLIECD